MGPQGCRTNQNVNSQNYKIGKVVGEQIGRFRTMWEPTNGTFFCGINKKILKRSSNLEIMSYGFPKEKKHISENSRKVWFI